MLNQVEKLEWTSTSRTEQRSPNDQVKHCLVIFKKKKLSTLQSRQVYPRPVLPDFKNSARFSSVWERDLAHVEPKRKSCEKNNTGKDSVDSFDGSENMIFHHFPMESVGIQQSMYYVHFPCFYIYNIQIRALQSTWRVYMSCRCKSCILFWVLFNTFGRSALDLLGIAIGI